MWVYVFFFGLAATMAADIAMGWTDRHQLWSLCISLFYAFGLWCAYLLYCLMQVPPMDGYHMFG